MFHGAPFGKHWLNRKISRKRQRRENLRTRQRSWLWTKNIDFPERSLKMRCKYSWFKKNEAKKASGTGVARSLYSSKFLIELIRRRRFFFCHMAAFLRTSIIQLLCAEHFPDINLMNDSIPYSPTSPFVFYESDTTVPWCDSFCEVLWQKMENIISCEELIKWRIKDRKLNYSRRLSWKLIGWNRIEAFPAIIHSLPDGKCLNDVITSLKVFLW